MRNFVAAALTAIALASAGCGGESRPAAWDHIHLADSIGENAKHGCLRVTDHDDRCGQAAKSWCAVSVSGFKRLREVADPSEGPQARLDHDTAVQGLYLCKLIAESG